MRNSFRLTETIWRKNPPDNKWDSLNTDHFDVTGNVVLDALSVVDEMEYCYRELGIREIDFFDPVFTMRRDRVFEICDDLERRDLKGLIWSIRARTDRSETELSTKTALISRVTSRSTNSPMRLRPASD